MTTSTVFINNRTQAVRLPVELRFADEIKQVNVRTVGSERIITPIAETWDSFFKTAPLATDDFMATRASNELFTKDSGKFESSTEALT